VPSPPLEVGSPRVRRRLAVAVRGASAVVWSRGLRGTSGAAGLPSCCNAREADHDGRGAVRAPGRRHGQRWRDAPRNRCHHPRRRVARLGRERFSRCSSPGKAAWNTSDGQRQRTRNRRARRHRRFGRVRARLVGASAAPGTRDLQRSVPGLGGVVKMLAKDRGPSGIRIYGILSVRIATERVRQLDALSGDPDEVRAANLRTFRCAGTASPRSSVELRRSCFPWPRPTSPER
jgi:hypothetical protein